MKPSSLNRRNFIRMGAALPIASAVLPSLATSAFAEAAGAVGAIPAVGYIDVPANVALLNINEYPAGPTPAAVEIMHKMAANGNRYYMSETSKFATELAAYHELKPNYLTIYAGSSEVLHFTTLAFTSPTRSLVTADPTFEQTWRVAAANGAKVHKVPLKADYSHDMKAMVAADPNAGMYYLCNPNNPTGIPIKRADIEWLLANKAPGSVVLVDEAYIQFSDAESVIDLVSKDKDLIVSRTFSKILQHGWAAVRVCDGSAGFDGEAALLWRELDGYDRSAVCEGAVGGQAAYSAAQAGYGRCAREDVRVADEAWVYVYAFAGEPLHAGYEEAGRAGDECAGASERDDRAYVAGVAELCSRDGR